MMPGEVLCYQFDDVIVDLRAGRVLKGGLPLALEPKAYDLLVLLASRAGALVSKQDVLDQVWAGVYVTDNAVARVIAQLRRALGDSAREARYIETVPTRGYRFIGEVTRDVAPVQTSIPPTAAPRAEALAPAVAPPIATRDGGPGPAAPPTASASHPVWAAGLALVALLSFFFAWRSQRAPVVTAGAPLRTQITSSAALDAFPTWSPDGRAIAYASDRSGRFELFVRDLAAGGDRLALTSDGQHNVQPAWSPDGQSLAYHSSGQGGIWVIPRHGGTPRQISPFGSRPAWSPDGRRVAFQGGAYTEPSSAAFETFGPSSLWVVAAAGGTPTRVTEAWLPGGSHTRPTWFPDGRRLFFGSQDVNQTTFWTVDIENGALVRVLDAGRRAVDPYLAPDGRSAYYVRMDAHFDLWKLPLTESGTAAGAPHLVLPSSELDVRHVAVHPDSQQVAYVAMATVSGLRSLPLHPDGVPAGPSVRLAEDAVRTARRPSFSPDAARVAFERQSAGLPPALWLLDLARGSVTSLARDDQGAVDPAWSGDGKQVYFESGRDEQRSLKAVRVDTGEVRSIVRLADGDQHVLRPRVSPDGSQLAYTRSQAGQLEVWVRTLADGRERQVARLGDGAAFPAWSPDGKALALDVWREGHAQVHVVELATGESRQVSRDVDQAWVRSWSPDSRRLAFAGARDSLWNVWSVGRDGTGQLQLTNYGDEHHYVRNPEWSPRGDRLIYEFASFAGNVWVVKAP
ncbi:MAG TPA: winged helix-turn-helix domain-containing protein [Luteitalea sp.]|nr:winged helix-turn-helix domain-containing protein [Luteitalea sp.]